MPLYHIDVQVSATAYIRAANAQEAQRIAHSLRDGAIYADGSEEGAVPVSSLRYDDPNLPDVSLSPAMTLYGPQLGAWVELAEGEEPGDLLPQQRHGINALDE